MLCKDLFSAGLRPAKQCASNPAPLMCWVNATKEKDTRFLCVRHTVGKAPPNGGTVRCDCDQRVARHINVAPRELLHHVVDRVTDRIPHMGRICIDKLDERGRINFRLHWAEHRSWWEQLLNLF